eukprot:gb/GECH01000240.1/.p1 GENE.gb/GECH01000240.1/~~gb/GECH01000240.1/.p1  ORF type:complete len:313 (+),score=61.95 gb/GECH01000240.1/:1-939(+)
MSQVAVDTNTKGEFVRKESQFRNWIRKGGEFPPEANRYHIYVSYACPWAHRSLILRAVKGLEDVISYSVVSPYLQKGGWHFADDSEIKGAEPDPLYGASHLKELYLKADPEYNGRITVPTLWDKKKETIVNNESAEIIRMLNSEFNDFAKNPSLDLYPENLRKQIDDVNSWIYPTVNNGVYRCGFATTQSAYEEAFNELFSSLDRIEDILSQNRYLVGDQFTEADVRLFTTLIRFDSVYFGHFKCNQRMIEHYPHMANYLREIYQMPGVKPTVNFEHIKNHYYWSHDSINPKRIVPVGPKLNYDTPHNRDKI